MNKKGDLPSIIFAVVSIFAVAVIVFFMSHVFDAIYTAADNAYSLADDDYNDSQAQQTLQKIQTDTNDSMDYVILYFIVGVVLSMSILSYSTRISNVYFFIYIMASFFIVMIATITSTVWQNLSENSEFAVTITRFPITDTLLKTYYPTFALVLVLITVVFLFGKPSEGR